MQIMDTRISRPAAVGAWDVVKGAIWNKETGTLPNERLGAGRSDGYRRGNERKESVSDRQHQKE